MIKFKTICLVALLAITIKFKAGNKTLDSKDLFGTRVFIENKGQFNSELKSGEEIKYVYDSGKEHIFFTTKGVVYKFIKKFQMTEEQRERMEKGRSVKPKPDEVYYVNVNWIGANENIQIEESNKQSHYFTYGGPEWNSYGYKKITYKNVYNNIDIEYTFPEDKSYGIKYNIILHPGANPNDIKISYTGDVNKIVKKGDDIMIKTPLEKLIEHAPNSFYDNKEAVVSEFKLEENVISFNFPNGYQNNRTLIIDPFVATLVNLTSTNYGFDIDYDYLGNLYVYGGYTLNKVAKFNSAGVLLWTFSGNLIGVPWNSDGDLGSISGNFIVNKINNKIYIGTGFEFAGTRIVRLDAAGNYDNFVTTPVGTWRECWDMGFHCGTGKLYGLGGGTFGNANAGLIDQITGTVVAANFTGLANAQQDIVSNAIDDQGNIFVIFAGPNVNNKILRVNPGFNGNIWLVPSTFNTFNEAGNKSNFIGANFGGGTANGFNCLAVNNSFLYYFDGTNLAAYNKTTGALVASTIVPGLGTLQQGGITVDDCNNLYIGGNGNILCYNFTGVVFNPLPSIPLGVGTPNQYVYDIKLDRNINLLYFTGSGFVGTKNATQSLGCGGTNQFAVSSICVGNNNGTGVASLTTSLVNPLIDFIWTGPGGTVSVTNGTTATSNTVTNLPNGTYTVQMQINAPCGPVYVNTISINCCAPYSIIPTITQVGCTNTLSAVSITVVGGSTVSPTFTWSPVPGALAGNSLSATGLPAGITTISASYGANCLVTITVNILPTPPPVTFTINNLTGSYSITCTNPVINLAAVSNYTYGPLSYSWTSPSFTAGTSTVSITQSNTLLVVVTDPITGCYDSQTVVIVTNTTTPTNSVAPLSQAITCNSAPVTFTGTAQSPTINVQHDWFSPLNPLPGGVPIATSNNTISILSATISPGTYTLRTTDLFNGCTVFKTFTVTSLDAWPTFSVSSPTNYSIGCSPLHQTTINIVNPQSTQTPSPATCSFTFLPPGFVGAVSPSVILGGNTSTITQIPGTWTVIVQDNSNFCRTILSVPIIQNTVAPHVAASILQQTLTCYQPTLLATGTSSTPNTVITWGIPVAPNQLSTPTVEVGPANGPNTSSTSLTYANYTVIATNTVNACMTTSVVVINQNFKPPISSPTISIGTPTAIYCTAGIDPVILTTGASTTTSGGGPLAYPIPVLWEGPSPQATVSGASSYSCFVPGIYTLTIMDNYNGCTKTGTINVVDKTQPPVLTNIADSSILDCGVNQAVLRIALTLTTTGIKYWFYAYPTGAAFSPSSAITPNGANPYLSGTSNSLTTVDKIGYYQYVATNTLTGCRAFGSFSVVVGGINADFVADPYSGYPPLQVNFTNNSSTSLGSASITSVWSFGNGTSQTTTSNINTSTTYNAPGSYTVFLITSRGTCLDTTFKVIKVDMPSKLEAPNVFTPNGDGSNDVFFLKTANLGEVTAIIFDRWGNKIYDVTSSTGNIAWDGKNFQGKECAEGVYFYVIKGKGNDSKTYETKGNVSLFR